MRWPLALALALACGSPPPTTEPVPAPAVDPPPAAALEPEPEPPPVAEQLDARRITDADFARKRLYSWTTPAQVEQLRESNVLLRVGPRSSPYSRLLDELAANDEAAARLRELQARRYAWPFPFATVLGRGPRRYGTSLVAIDLRDDAQMVRLDPSLEPPLTAFDMSGAPTELDLDRVAAVFHVRTESGTPARFREYIVVRESMVASWEVATDAIAATVDADIAVLEALQAPFSALTEHEQHWPAARRWRSDVATPTLVTRWHQTLAFDNVRYRPTSRNLAAMIAALREYDPAGQPYRRANVQ